MANLAQSVSRPGRRKDGSQQWFCKARQGDLSVTAEVIKKQMGCNGYHYYRALAELQTRPQGSHNLEAELELLEAAFKITNGTREDEWLETRQVWPDCRVMSYLYYPSYLERRIARSLANLAIPHGQHKFAEEVYLGDQEVRRWLETF